MKFSEIQNKISEKNLLLILAVVVGLLCGLAAVVLKLMISLIERGLTSWFSDTQDSLLLILYPGIGMILSMLVVKYLVKDNIGHGVTKVLQAVSKNESRIKRRHTWSSIVTSAITIGFGGSVGAEAPMVYTGAAIGSNVARAMGLSYKNMTLLLGCGAAGALAGIFKAPIAGVLFTLEILLFNISMSSILPIMLSSITATMVSYLLMGKGVQFTNDIAAFRMANIPWYVVLGVFSGLMSLYFTRTTLKIEDKLKNIKNSWTRWAFCAVTLGLIIYAFPILYGEGYESIEKMLNNQSSDVMGRYVSSFPLLQNPWYLLSFFAMAMLLKVVATSLTNGGGGVGGTFGPTLVTGGIAGFVMARLINLSGIAVVPEANFALVGMAGMMSGVMHAPLTAIFLIADITSGYELFVPLILTAAISFATIRMFEPYSIYTKRIASKGELLTHDSDQAVLTLLKTSQVIESDFTPIYVDNCLGDLVKTISISHRNIFPVLDAKGRFQGVVTLDDVRSMMFETSLYQDTKIYHIMKSSPAFVYQDEKMESVMRKFEDTGAWNLPVLDDENNYLGFVSKSKIFSSYRDQLKQVSHE